MSSTRIAAASKLALALALSITSLGVGYALGSFWPLPPPATLSSRKQPKQNDEDDGDEDVGVISDGDLAAVQAGFTEPCKLVIVVRTDLKMTPGKIAAQCGHATLACYKALVKKNPKLVQHWERIGQAKIALKGTSEEQLLELEAIAKSLNLCARSVEDAGRTQIEEGTRTVLGIGPAPVPLINQVTGHLRLL